MEKQLKLDEIRSFLPFETLLDLGKQNHHAYIEAKPFSHGVYDDIFDPTILDYVLDEFESSDEWRGFDTKYEKKLQQSNDEKFGSVTRSLIHSLNSAPFLNFLQDLTGIKGLIPDPYLVGGGLHKITRGGKLGVHVDFNRHQEMRVFRRVNVIIYLNKDWKEEYGGHFQLWDKNKSQCITKVLPVFNRMAIFTTTNTSFHGHPEPLTCPENRARRSLALYYYTAEESGEQAQGSHSTIFMGEKGNLEELGKVTFLGRVRNKIKKILGNNQ